MISIVIILAGMISSGKTTYTKRLAEELGTRAFFEPVEDNPILEKYYDDPEAFAFTLQIFFLNKRFDLIKQAYYEDDNVLDRSIYEDRLFTYINYLQGTLTKEEFDIYSDLLDNMMEEIDGLPKKAPDLLIYLHRDFESILNNIRKRGRVYEQFEDGDETWLYYKKLHEHYDDWFKSYDKSPKLLIHADQFDVHQEEDWQEVYQIIKRALDDARK